MKLPASLPTVPPLSNNSSHHKRNSIGGNGSTHSPNNSEAAAAADLYGYESGSPTTAKRQQEHPIHYYDGTRVPRRSSLKGSSEQQSGVSRRASIGCSATVVVVEVRKGGERVPVQRRRSIDFNTTVEIKEVAPVTDIVQSSELWLQPDDFEKMKTERRRIVSLHKQGKAEPNEEMRGLEKYLDREIRVQKNRAWDTVLLEQDEQELTGNFNDQRIADLYKRTTFKSPEKAAALGQADHEAVRDYLTSPRTTKLMMRRCSC